MANSYWRDRLRPASFRGVEFHVEISALASGRRPVLHEFPKRDQPYSEDMGRKAGGFTITAYIVGPFYTLQRGALRDALETEGPGPLVHPTLGEFDVQAGPCSFVERRERGGYVEAELNFLEAGSRDPFTTASLTQQAVKDAAAAAKEQIGRSFREQLRNAGPGKDWV